MKEWEKFKAELYSIVNLKAFIEWERKWFAINMNMKVDDLEKSIILKDKQLAEIRFDAEKLKKILDQYK